MEAPNAVDTANVLANYRRSLAGFDEVIAHISDDAWDRPSRCSEWTVRDVVGHVTWGQRYVHAMATGTQLESGIGAPGSPNAGDAVGDRPLEQWAEARDQALAVLDGEALSRVVEIGGPFGTAPLQVFASALALVDTPAHTWDAGAGAGLDVTLDPALLDQAMASFAGFDIARDTPGGIKAPLEPPPGADLQTRFLAHLGRQAW